MVKRVYNFFAGPATLPLSVIEEASKNVLEFENLGLSILEISHRAKEFDNVIKEAQKDVKELMGLGDNYHVLFLQGGASLQFHMIPLNLMESGKPALYVNTGAWSKKAIKESQVLDKDNTKVVASSEEKNFSYIPKDFEVDQNASYLHITTNNTIFGTEYHYIPETGNVPLIADMSSDILCRNLDFKKFAVIYAGAQKNLGPAGTTLVIIRDDMVKRCENKKLPTLLNYKTHVDKESLFNTPSVFAVYVVHLVLKWIKDEMGGLENVEKYNRKKADLLYSAIDEMNDFYKGTAEKDSRSLMNVTFRLPNEELEKKFVAEAAERDLIGLKGHRSVGGIRASIYNAFPYEGVEKLVEFMRDFRKNN